MMAGWDAKVFLLLVLTSLATGGVHDQILNSEEEILRDLNEAALDLPDAGLAHKVGGPGIRSVDIPAAAAASSEKREVSVNGVNICGRRLQKVRDTTHTITVMHMARETYKGRCRDHNAKSTYDCVQWRVQPRMIKKKVAKPVFEERSVCCDGFHGDNCEHLVRAAEPAPQVLLRNIHHERREPMLMARAANPPAMGTAMSQFDSSPYHALCALWGYDHLRAFNGRFINFTGGCQYTLVKHDTVDIAFENEDSCLIPRTLAGCQRRLVLRLKKEGETVDVNIFKAKNRPVATVQTRGVDQTLPTKIAHAFFEHVGGYIIIKSNKWKILFDFNKGGIQILFAEVSVDGLCGDMNAIPGHIANDQISTYEAPWKRPSDHDSVYCSRPEYIRFKGQDPCLDPHLTEQQRIIAKARCADINGSDFAVCHGLNQSVLNLNLFLEACERDLCAGILDGVDVTRCPCSAATQYARQCKLFSAAAAATLSWRRSDFCIEKCGKDQEYRECGSSCPRCCAAVDADPADCTDCCIDGCACKDGFYANNTLCYQKHECSCSYMGAFYEPGAVIYRRCNNCTCDSGKWTCSNNVCAGQCSLTGDNRVITFDSKVYSNLFSECSYELVNCEDLDLIIEVKFSPCPDFPTSNCMTLVRITLGGKVDILMTRTSQVIIDEGHTYYTLPYTSTPPSYLLSVVNASSHFRSITISNVHTPDVVVEWNGEERLYVYLNSASKKLPSSIKKCKGLCGNYDGDTENELDGLPVPGFVDSHRTAESYSSGQCVPVTPPGQCPDSVENTKKHCETLLQSKNVFGPCWSAVPLIGSRYGSFTQTCEEDVCNCPDRDSTSTTPGLSCLCQSLATYAHLCAVNGIRLNFRENFPQCKIQCPPDQRYKECGQPCPTLCPMVLSSREELCNVTSCLEGCECETGYFRDQTPLGRCVPLKECSCIYNGQAYNPGDVVVRNEGTSPEKCICKDGTWVCEPYVPDPMDCAHGMTFETCVSPCQPTCQNRNPSHCTSLACVQRCACPAGQYQVSDSDKRCVNETECPCFYGGRPYPPNYIYPMSCNNCTCTNGEFECTNLTCPGFCAATGDPHYETFDGLRYSFQGQTKYVLAQFKTEFKIFVENVECGADGVTCTKSVEIHLSPFNSSGIIIKLKQELDFTVNGVAISPPYDVCSIRIIYNNLFLIVEDVAREFKVSWDGSMRVYVEVNPCYGGLMEGLCGNFDGDAGNDLQARSGIQEANVYAFGNSWKVDPFALDTPLQYSTTCDLKGAWRRLYSKNLCERVLLSDVFAACRAVVDVSYYLERCIDSTCACDLPGDDRCKCTSFAHYAHTCGRHGVCVLWREQFGCPMQCTGTSEYDSCSCPSRCPDTDEDCTRLNYYEGCTCPDGTVYNGVDCIPCPTCNSTAGVPVPVGAVETGPFGTQVECLSGHSDMAPVCEVPPAPPCEPCADEPPCLFTCPQCQLPVHKPAYLDCCRYECIKPECPDRCKRRDPWGHFCSPKFVTVDDCCGDNYGCPPCPYPLNCTCEHEFSIKTWNVQTCCYDYSCVCNASSCDDFVSGHHATVVANLQPGESLTPVTCKPGQCDVVRNVTAETCGSAGPCCTASVLVYSCECRENCTDNCPPPPTCDPCFSLTLIRPKPASVINGDCCAIYECQYDNPTCSPSCVCTDKFPVETDVYGADCCPIYNCECVDSKCPQVIAQYKTDYPLSGGQSYEITGTYQGKGICVDPQLILNLTECGCCNVSVYAPKCCVDTCDPPPTCSNSSCPRQRLKITHHATLLGIDCCNAYECEDIPPVDCPDHTCCPAEDVVTALDLFNTTTCCNIHQCVCNDTKCQEIRTEIAKTYTIDPITCPEGYCLNETLAEEPISPGCDGCCPITIYTCVPATTHPACSHVDLTTPCPCSSQQRTTKYTNDSCCPEYPCVCVNAPVCSALRAAFVLANPNIIYDPNYDCGSYGSDLVFNKTRALPDATCPTECCSIDTYDCICKPQTCPPYHDEMANCTAYGGIWKVTENATLEYPSCCPVFNCRCASCDAHDAASEVNRTLCEAAGGTYLKVSDPTGIVPDCCTQHRCVCECATCPSQTCPYCERVGSVPPPGLCSGTTLTVNNSDTDTCCTPILECESNCTSAQPSTCPTDEELIRQPDCCYGCYCKVDVCNNCPPKPAVNTTCLEVVTTTGKCSDSSSLSGCCDTYQTEETTTCNPPPCGNANQVIDPKNYSIDKCCDTCICACTTCNGPPQCGECEHPEILQHGHCSNTSLPIDLCCPSYHCVTNCPNPSTQPQVCTPPRVLIRKPTEDCCFRCECNCSDTSLCSPPVLDYPLCQMYDPLTYGQCDGGTSDAAECCSTYEINDIPCTDCPITPLMGSSGLYIPGRIYTPADKANGTCCSSCPCNCSLCDYTGLCPCPSRVLTVTKQGNCSGPDVPECCDTTQCDCITTTVTNCSDSKIEDDVCGCPQEVCDPAEAPDAPLCCCGNLNTTSGNGAPCTCHDRYDCVVNRRCPFPDGLTDPQIDALCPTGFMHRDQSIGPTHGDPKCSSTICEDCAVCVCTSCEIQTPATELCPAACPGCITKLRNTASHGAIEIPVGSTPMDPCCEPYKECDTSVCPGPPTCAPCFVLKKVKNATNDPDTCGCCDEYACEAYSCPYVPPINNPPIPTACETPYNVTIVVPCQDPIQLQCNCECQDVESNVTDCDCPNAVWTPIPSGCPTNRCSKNKTAILTCKDEVLYNSTIDPNCPDCPPLHVPVCDSMLCCYCKPPPPPPECNIIHIFDEVNLVWNAVPCPTYLAQQGANASVIEKAQMYGMPYGCNISDLCPPHVPPPLPCRNSSINVITVERTFLPFPDCCARFTYCLNGDCTDPCCNPEPVTCGVCERAVLEGDLCNQQYVCERYCNTTDPPCSNCPADFTGFISYLNKDECNCTVPTCMCNSCSYAPLCCPPGQCPVMNGRVNDPDNCNCSCGNMTCDHRCPEDYLEQLAAAEICKNQTNFNDLALVCSATDVACPDLNCKPELCPAAPTCPPNQVLRITYNASLNFTATHCDCCNEYECVCPTSVCDACPDPLPIISSVCQTPQTTTRKCDDPLIAVPWTAADVCCSVHTIVNETCPAPQPPVCCPDEILLPTDYSIDRCCPCCRCNCTDCAAEPPLTYPLCQTWVVDKGYCDAGDDLKAGKPSCVQNCCDQFTLVDYGDTCPPVLPCNKPGYVFIPKDKSAGRCCDQCVCNCSTCAAPPVCGGANCAKELKTSVIGNCSAEYYDTCCNAGYTCECPSVGTYTQVLLDCLDTELRADACGCPVPKCKDPTPPPECCCGSRRVTHNGTGVPCNCHDQHSQCEYTDLCPVGVTASDDLTGYCPSPFVAVASTIDTMSTAPQCSGTVCEHCGYCKCPDPCPAGADICGVGCVGCETYTEKGPDHGMAIPLSVTPTHPGFQCCLTNKRCNSGLCPSPPTCAKCEVLVTTTTTNDVDACDCCDTYACVPRNLTCPTLPPLPMDPEIKDCGPFVIHTIRNGTDCPDLTLLEQECSCPCIVPITMNGPCNCTNSTWSVVPRCVNHTCSLITTETIFCNGSALYRSSMNDDCEPSICMDPTHFVCLADGCCDCIPPPPPKCGSIYVWNNVTGVYDERTCLQVLEAAGATSAELLVAQLWGVKPGCTEVCPPSPVPPGPQPCTDLAGNGITIEKVFADYPDCCGSTVYCKGANCTGPFCCYPDNSTCPPCKHRVYYTDGAGCNASRCDTTPCPPDNSCALCSDTSVLKTEAFDSCDCKTTTCRCPTCPAVLTDDVCCELGGGNYTVILLVDDPLNCTCNCSYSRCEPEPCPSNYTFILAQAEICANETDVDDMQADCLGSCRVPECKHCGPPTLQCPGQYERTLKRNASHSYINGCDCCDEYECTCPANPTCAPLCPESLFDCGCTASPVIVQENCCDIRRCVPNNNTMDVPCDPAELCDPMDRVWAKGACCYTCQICAYCPKSGTCPMSGR